MLSVHPAPKALSLKTASAKLEVTPSKSSKKIATRKPKAAPPVPIDVLLGIRKPKKVQKPWEMTPEGYLQSELAFIAAERGAGVPDSPFQLPLRAFGANQTGCDHCPADRCICKLFQALLDESIEECMATFRLKRVTEVAGKRELCAKSILPPFVARMTSILRLRPDDTFYDLGAGNGSVLFQVAATVGCKCVGVEISEENARLSQAIWNVLKPKLELALERPMPEVTLLHDDLINVIKPPTFGTTGKTAIWSANLLLPRSVTHYMSERFRTLAVGSRIVVFDDLFPHSRSVARIRDPECFELFSMTDYQWPPGSVEWTFQEGSFYANVKIA